MLLLPDVVNELKGEEGEGMHTLGKGMEEIMGLKVLVIAVLVLGFMTRIRRALEGAMVYTPDLRECFKFLIAKLYFGSREGNC